ncbi:MAG: helix-hairpin-helix domain-containing protein [Lachnospiraceae bacterium]
MKKISIIISTILVLLIMSSCGKEMEFQGKQEVEIHKTEKTTTVQEEKWYVQVCGAVVEPGVYCLPAESRIADAVLLAGGLTKAAALESVNQAEKIKDGQMILVLTKKEWTKSQQPGGDGETQAGLLNINCASKQELMELPGVGESRADEIITYRETKGSFHTIEDIMKISGIKEGIFDKIKDKICVD